MTTENQRQRLSVAAAIRAEAKGRGFTYGQLAKRAGIATSTFDTYISETDPVDLKLTRLRQIADALGMTASDLLDEADRWEIRLFGEES